MLRWNYNYRWHNIERSEGSSPRQNDKNNEREDPLIVSWYQLMGISCLENASTGET